MSTIQRMPSLSSDELRQRRDHLKSNERIALPVALGVGGITTAGVAASLFRIGRNDGGLKMLPRIAISAIGGAVIGAMLGGPTYGYLGDDADRLRHIDGQLADLECKK